MYPVGWKRRFVTVGFNLLIGLMVRDLSHHWSPIFFTNSDWAKCGKSALGSGSGFSIGSELPLGYMAPRLIFSENLIGLRLPRWSVLWFCNGSNYIHPTGYVTLPVCFAFFWNKKKNQSTLRILAVAARSTLVRTSNVRLQAGEAFYLFIYFNFLNLALLFLVLCTNARNVRL